MNERPATLHAALTALVYTWRDAAERLLADVSGDRQTNTIRARRAEVYDICANELTQLLNEFVPEAAGE